MAANLRRDEDDKRRETTRDDERRRETTTDDDTTQAMQTQLQPPDPQLNGNPSLRIREKSRVWQAIVPGTQNKPQDTLQIRKTPWHGETKQPPAIPLPGPNVTPEPNEKIKGLAGNCSRQTKKATRHPSNQENTLARRDETASCRPVPGPNVTPEPCLLYTSPSPRDGLLSRMPSSA